MIKKRIAVVVAALLVLLMLPGLALGVQVTLTLSQSSAAAGDSITASGIADPGEWVSIKIVDSSGTSIVVYDAVMPDASGNYNCTFKVPTVVAGNLTVVAGYGSNVATETLTIGSGGETVPITGVSLNKGNISIIKDTSVTLLVTVAPANASNKAVNWSSSNGAVATVDGNGQVSGVAAGTATITVSTVDGNKTASCAVTVTRSETASNAGTINVGDAPLTITVPQGVSSSIAVTQSTALPLVEINSQQVDMIIPPGTQVTGSDTIKLPEVMASSSVNIAAAQQVDLVIKVGSELGTVTFSKPVKLVLKGQGSKSAGFIDSNGNFAAISKLAGLNGLAADTDADAVASVLTNAGVAQGAVASGSDLIIWTKHFTRFVAYTPTSSNPPGGGGGGVVAPAVGQAVTSSGATVTGSGAIVLIPAGAVSSDIKVNIQKLDSASVPSVPSGYKLLGEVYEITKDKTGNFAKAVIITLPFDRSKVDKDKEEAAIYCWNNNRWTVLSNVKVDMEAGKVSGEVDHFSKFAVLAQARAVPAVAPAATAVELNDISGHWAEDNIYKLVNIGAVGGYSDGIFKPDNNITRAEFATMLVKACALEPRSGKVFNDTSGHWAQDSISTAAAYGIVSGYDETSFGPNNLITREQMAVMIIKARARENKEGKTFADSVKISDWAKTAVATASGHGIINGYPDNTFRPQANATRAEAVTVVVKALN